MPRRVLFCLVPLLLSSPRALPSEAAEPGAVPKLFARNLEAPFCYLPGGSRGWPILAGRLAPPAALTLTARQDGTVVAQGRELSFSGLSVAVSDEGRLQIDAQPEVAVSFELEISLEQPDLEAGSQRLVVRPAPPDRPITYVADLVDDIIRIFADPQTGKFRPIEKSAFDQYFRRLQAQGISRLIVWQSPFAYMTDPQNHRPEDWVRYQEQALAILECRELTEALKRQGRLVAWGWLRQLLAIRQMPEFGPMFTQSATDHGVALSASFRPFEAALTKYYEVPAFDADGTYLWGFMPLASPEVTYHPDEVCFAHYRTILAEMGNEAAGRLGTIEMPLVQGANGADQLVERFRADGGTFEAHASHFPPIAGDSFVLVRQSAGGFKLRPYREIQDQTEAGRHRVTGFRLEEGDEGTVRVTGLNVPSEYRYLILTTSAPAKQSIELAGEAPVRLWSQAGNRMDRETVYWVLDESVPGGVNTRVAAITPTGEYRAEFQANEASIRHFLDKPGPQKLAGKALVIDLGARWSVEMIDFNRPAARRFAVAQLKTLLGHPPFDEIFINTRSHVDLAMSTADGQDGVRPMAHYWREKRAYRNHLGLDKAYAPLKAAADPQLQAAAGSPQTVEQITTWQPDEWKGTCQSADGPFLWRFVRNRTVADGVRLLLLDLERAFPDVRIRAVIPPRAEAVERIEDGLEAMRRSDGGTYGRQYYRRLWCSNNHIPAIGEGMAMVDLSETGVEPVFLGSGGYSPDREPFRLFVRECLADMADNRGSNFRGPRSYFCEAQFTLRAKDKAAARRTREEMICHLLAQEQEIGEVILYEAADWTYYLSLSDPDLSGHHFVDRCGNR